MPIVSEPYRSPIFIEALHRQRRCITFSLMLFRPWRALLIPLIVAVLCSCDIPKGAEADEQKNPHFIEGKERTKARDTKGAIEAFQRALDANPNSVLAHFEL